MNPMDRDDWMSRNDKKYKTQNIRRIGWARLAQAWQSRRRFQERITLWCQDSSADGMSLPSDEERAVSSPRRPEYGTENGRGTRAQPTGKLEARVLLAGNPPADEAVAATTATASGTARFLDARFQFERTGHGFAERNRVPGRVALILS
jgi:hypothetical protein